MYSDTGRVSLRAWNLRVMGQLGSPQSPFPLHTAHWDGIIVKVLVLEGLGFSLSL